MIFTPPLALILWREAIISALISYNRRSMNLYEKGYRLKCLTDNIIDGQLDILHSYGDDDSEIYEEILKHFRDLNERFFMDLRMCFNNFRADAEWLSENMYKFDFFHMFIWCTLSDQAREYRDILDRMFERCWNFNKIFIYIYSLKNPETFNHDHL